MIQFRTADGAVSQTPLTAKVTTTKKGGNGQKPEANAGKD